MRLSIKAMAMTSGLLWGGCMLAAGFAHLLDAAYAKGFLEVMSSVYPGYHPAATIGNALLGAAYGMLDGWLFGVLFGWLYDLMLRRPA